MWNLEKLLGYLGGSLSVLVGWHKFGWAGVVLVFAMFMSCRLYYSGVQLKGYEDAEE